MIEMGRREAVMIESYTLSAPMPLAVDLSMCHEDPSGARFFV